MTLDPLAIGVFGFILMLILIFLRVPVAFAMAFIGFIGFWAINGLTPSLNVARETFYNTLQDESFLAIPFFVLMGYFAYYSGLVDTLFKTAQKWVGHTPGGLAQATVVGGAGFGATTGSGMASTATLAKIAFPEMIKSGVDKKLAYGVIATAGPLACLIPPSVLLIVFAIITQQSIGKLLIAGILPGLFAAGVYLVVVYGLVKRNPSIAPSLPKVPLRERIRSIKEVWAFLLLIFLIIAGLYTGTFTPTEAGAAGSFIGFVMLLIFKGFQWENIRDALLQTIITTGMIFLLIASTSIFGYFMTSSRIPTKVSEFLVTLPVDPLVILIGIIILYIIMGMFMDMVSGMLLTLPIIFPAIVSLGFDPIWFGVMLVFLVELALVTPPFGLSLFILKGAVPDSEMRDIYKGSTPFIFASFVIVILFIVFPQIITFLPALSAN